MDAFGLILIVTAAILWGATDALIKLFTPPKFNHESRVKNSVSPGLISSLKTNVSRLLEDFLVLVQSPEYILCQVTHMTISTHFISWIIGVCDSSSGFWLQRSRL